MRQLSHQLKSSAHPIYNEGLEKTGISIEKIPSIEEMNKCLNKLGWMAIVVDGFIPPQAFMELQALKVLAIALEMRSLEHILYTPAPDIVHESAGHAPMVYDAEYSVYLQSFGEIGVKAMFTKQDKEVYEAVRHLSIMKGYPSTTKEEIKQAEENLNNKLNQKFVGELLPYNLMVGQKNCTVIGTVTSLSSPLSSVYVVVISISGVIFVRYFLSSNESTDKSSLSTNLLICCFSELPSTEAIILFIRLVIVLTTELETFFNAVASLSSSFSSL